MQKVGEHSVAPETVKEAISLARKAKTILCPIPSAGGASVKIIKSDYIYLLQQMGDDTKFEDDRYGHQGGVYNENTGVMCL